MIAIMSNDFKLVIQRPYLFLVVKLNYNHPTYHYKYLQKIYVSLFQNQTQQKHGVTHKIRQTLNILIFSTFLQVVLLFLFQENCHLLAVFCFILNIISNSKQIMQQKQAIIEDSFTLDNYIQITKRETLLLKRMRKESQTYKRERKGSTQLSIFGWLNQTSNSQKSLILTLDKYLILKILSYLRLSQLVVASQVCSYFLSCYRFLWNDKQFFCQLETDKLTSKELGKLIEKSSKLDHIRQLKQIYSGKNIKNCRQKIKIKVGQGNPNTGGMLQIFSVTPKNIRSGSTFILDSHITQIVNSSFRSLRIIELVKCSFVKEFVCLSRCTELSKLTISYNDNFRNEDLGVICKRCKNIEILYFEQCRRLDENIFEHLQYVQYLQSFTLKQFKHSFLKVKKLQNNMYLTHLDIDGSLINDIEAFHLIRLKTISHLSINNCPLLTDTFLTYLIQDLNKTSLTQVSLMNSNFDCLKVQTLTGLLNKN